MLFPGPIINDIFLKNQKHHFIATWSPALWLPLCWTSQTPASSMLPPTFLFSLFWRALPTHQGEEYQHPCSNRTCSQSTENFWGRSDALALKAFCHINKRHRTKVLKRSWHLFKSYLTSLHMLIHQQDLWSSEGLTLFGCSLAPIIRSRSV